MEFSIPPLGFTNTGAICYFNALVQSLLSCKSFVQFICKEKQESIFYLFFKFIASEKKWDPFFTSKLLHVMQAFEPNQSSSEYFLKLCDHQKLDDLFSTKTETVTTCSVCQNETKMIDTSLYIVIDNDMNEFCESKREVDDFKCEKCNQKVKAEIVSRIKEISPIMVFSFNKYFSKKNIPYSKGFIVDGDKEYRLISTVEHQGVLQSGHYFCRTFRNGELLNLNDTSVSKIDNMDSSENTYMVFYERIK